MVARVVGEQLRVGVAGGRREGAARRRGGFGVIVARADRQQECHGVSVVHHERIVGGGDTSTVGKRPKSHGKLGAALRATAHHHHSISAVGPRDRAHPPEQSTKRDEPRPARGEANHQRSDRCAAKNLARVRDAAALKRRAHHRGVEIEFTPVVTRVRDVGFEL